MSNDGAKKCGCNCEELHLQMYALLDRELTPDECARLERHLETCPECRARFEAEADLRKLLRKCCCGPAPKTLREKITYSIRVERFTITER
ncbi:mycothiol system anti-sigma-R factor [Corynebacterium vitaeruminis]|uniref:Anti-sigma factor n=1 Tax=Corynebacterium vitaeruminis DSM 20294 TaxID=1224164 RepID=W5XZA3_9CORY|nr:mycothiol system anti-sigma-R factor [Corynebacterium vitaeruminis]AHI22024.1 Anti-sigma factor [Corynebacterium vitaeruminis DSM 20294]